MTTPDDPDDFAAHLRAYHPAPLPAHWRANILAAAIAHATPPPATPRCQAALRTLADFLWPHPYAYAGLLAVWLLVLTLQLATPAPAPSVPAQSWTANGSNDYQSALSRDLLAINAVLADASQSREGRP